MSESRPDPAAAVDEELNRGGYRADCARCRVALAVNGHAACPRHYVPVRERVGPSGPGAGGGR